MPPSPPTLSQSTTLKLYVALVRPHFEYAVQVWNPHHAKDINCLEKLLNLFKKLSRILSKSAGFLYINYHHFRIGVCLCTFYCIVTGLVYFPSECLTMATTYGRNYNPCAYRVPRAHLNGFQIFFANTIRLWNNLPHEAVTSQDLFMFKH